MLSLQDRDGETGVFSRIKSPGPKNKFSAWGFAFTTKTRFLTAGFLTRGSSYRPPLPASLR
jgi:hypothetical protein